MTRRKSFNNTTTAFKRWCKNNLSNEYSSECAEYMQIVDGLYVAFSIKEIKEKIIIMSQVATYTNNNFESLSENIDKYEDILKNNVRRVRTTYTKYYWSISINIKTHSLLMSLFYFIGKLVLPCIN